MALKGNLSTVSLADIFQALSHGHSTGLLRIQAPEGTRFVEILDGQVSIVARTTNRILLGDLLLSRGLIDEATLNKALASQKQSGKLLGQALMEMGVLQLVDIENALRFQIEEEICDLFLLKSAEFDFLTNATLDAKMALGSGLVRLKIDPNGLLLEAARRLDDWSKLEQRIPSQSMLFDLSKSAQDLLKSGEGLSPEGLILLKLATEGRTVESMVQKACLGRLNTNLLLSELWDADLVKPTPPERYLKVAEEHLNNGRIEEAERVATQALKTDSDKGRRDGLNKVLAEIEKKKRAGAPTEKDTSRIRSEVIRRPNPSLILRKQRSPVPFVLGGLAVLALTAGALYWFVFRPHQASVNLDEQKQFDAWVNQVDSAANQENYAMAIDLLKHNYKDPQLREKANDVNQRFKKNLEAKLTPVLNEAEAALAGGDQAAIQKALDQVEIYNKLQIFDGALNQSLSDTMEKFRRWKERVQCSQFEDQLKKIEGLPSCDDQAVELGKLLTQSPAEAVATKIRDSLARLDMRAGSATYALALGLSMEEAGDLDGAKGEYENVRRQYPGSALAKKAEAQLQKIGESAKQIAQQLNQLELWVVQKKPEAKDGLIKFLQSKPEALMADRARSMLRTLLAPELETGAEKELREADALDEGGKSPAGRKKRLEVLEKYAFTMASARVKLTVKIETEPKGCQVFVMGREVKDPTPATAEVPAVGLLRIRFKKKGFEDREFVAYDFRGDTITMRLERSLAAPLRLLPRVPELGMALHGNWLGMAAGNEVMAYDFGKKEPVEVVRHDLSADVEDAAAKKLDLLLFAPALGPAKGSEAPTLYIAAPQKGVWALPADTLMPRKLELNSPPLSSPIAFLDAAQNQKLCVGIATEEGYEHLNSAEGTRRFTPRRLGGTEVSKPLGIAFDGARFFVPRTDGNLYAIQVKDNQGWSVAMPPSPLAPPACNAAAKTVAILGASGKICVYESESDKKVYEFDVGGTCAVGAAAVGKGYAVVTEDGTLAYLSSEQPKAQWSVKVWKGVVLPPQAVGGKRLAVAAPGELIVLNADSGEIEWRAALPSPPVAFSADEKRIFVATKDARLRIFSVEE
ncbi:MAG: DUF4388 domain-containing protein [Planctomycetes bacterium]|nr:DUF4388 domain-containing protein [Planctomycetota bacterium]